MAEWVFRIVEWGGYWGVALLMFLETVFPPIPSEVVMPLAGVVAARGHLSLTAVIIAGTLGSMLGNLLWYGVAHWLGLTRFRPLIDRYGRWLTLDWAEIERAHRLFDTRGRMIVFVGRMLPTIRTLVSIPAGLLKMRFMPFMFWSTLGSMIWTAGLAVAGWVLGHEFSRVETVLGPVSLILIVGIALWYFYRVITWRPA